MITVIFIINLRLKASSIIFYLVLPSHADSSSDSVGLFTPIYSVTVVAWWRKS